MPKVISVYSAVPGAGRTAIVRRLSRGLRRFGVDVRAHHLGIQDAREIGPGESVSGLPSIWHREQAAPVLGGGVVWSCGPEIPTESAVTVVEGETEADLRICVVDALRPDAEIPDADHYVITKCEGASKEQVREIEGRIPSDSVTLTDFPIGVPDGPKLRARAAVVIESTSTLVAPLRGGAGIVIAKRYRCPIVDPRPAARGQVADYLERDERLSGVVPALADGLVQTVLGTPSEVIVWASNAEPLPELEADPRPVIRVFPEAMEVAGTGFAALLQPFLSNG